MTDYPEKINVHKTGMIAPLQNVALFNELVERVMNRPFGLPGLATFHGPSGYGKTFSATYAAHKFKAYYIQVGYTWTRKTFLEKLLIELGGMPMGTMSNMADQIFDILGDIDRPVIIDEFDYVVAKNFPELIREIHDETHAPIILIGEERLPVKLIKWERIHNRMLDWVAAQPLLREEVDVLARYNAPDVDIADDLLDQVFKLSEGRARRASINLNRIGNVTKDRGMSHINMKEWGKEELYIGKAMARTGGRR